MAANQTRQGGSAGGGARRPGGGSGGGSGRRPGGGRGQAQRGTGPRGGSQPAQATPAGGARIGDRIALTITGLGHNGAGVGRHNDIAVFVPYTCPGDEIVAEVTEARRDMLIGRLVSLRKESPSRVQPGCPVFGTCGGCQLQHIDYAQQLVLKTDAVRDALERIGKFEAPKVLPALGMTNPWSFRNKAQFPVAMRRGRLVAGFYAAGSHYLVPIETCPVQHPLNNKIMTETLKVAARHALPAYDERSGEGVLRHILAKVAAETGQGMAALVTNTRTLPREREVAQEIANRVPGLVSIVQNINQERTNVILGPVTRPLLGETTIEDRVGGLRFRLSAESFAQTNPAQAKVTYDLALAYANVTASDVVVDAYCGIGTITLLLARKAGKVYGVENVAAAVEDAKVNAKLNRLSNVEFVLGDAEKVLPDLAKRGVRPTVLVLDPPRKGVDNEVIHAALAMMPERIVYVSCEPSTLARDLAKLASGGYELVEAQPVDMFPHTAHVETVVLLDKVGDTTASGNPTAN